MAVREQKPLVQCITNMVTVNDCANIILAAGGSPTMTSHPLEVEEAVGGVQALVCNMGAIGKVESMILAGREANRLQKSVVLDPVGAGGTQLRRDAVKRLLKEVRFTAIRGNASEIRYLAGQNTVGSGVDVSALDEITEENLPATVAMAAELAERLGTVIAISGRIDVISNGRETCVLRGGCATMARITGSGCMLTSLMGAFCGAYADPFRAVCAAAAAMNLSGERAEEKRLRCGTGNATFRNDLIDAVFNLTEEQMKQGVHYEIYKR
ncbi:MAG: hydroxyethylthiazole kinase [Butyricicoccus sp.]|nr:hydroxyethylthiazole kinase [Butyricicoccus sp.]